jgi:hypothetical protein
METIYAVYDKEDALMGFYKCMDRALKLMDRLGAGSYMTEVETDFFGTLDGTW